MPTAVLPVAPAGRELEDFFAALLQSTGHYVEKNIEERNILELDVVATNYLEGKPRVRLFEVKGSSARLEDVFKLVGRMRYLGVTDVDRRMQWSSSSRPADLVRNAALVAGGVGQVGVGRIG